MKKVKYLTTTTYQYNDNYLIDIVKNDDEYTYDAWLYHIAYGVKELMFSMSSETYTDKTFLDIVKENVENYIENYREEFEIE